MSTITLKQFKFDMPHSSQAKTIDHLEPLDRQGQYHFQDLRRMLLTKPKLSDFAHTRTEFEGVQRREIPTIDTLARTTTFQTRIIC